MHFSQKKATFPLKKPKNGEFFKARIVYLGIKFLI